jgi:tocopherol cyclase
MSNFWQRMMHPEWYHGRQWPPPFFEGWYYKMVDAARQHPLAVIPGVFLSQEPHAFVQVLDGRDARATYHRYPLDQFQAAEDALEIQVGPNHFSANQIRLAIADAERPLQGEVSFSGLTAWPVTPLAPGIMGWYAWVPFMECYHGIVSLDHQLSGALTLGQERLNFAGGRGYIEKDWGSAFPEGYVWLQTNHFSQPGTSLTGSIAIIPWLGRAFRGFIIGFWHEQQLYRLATYTGARVESLAISDDHVDWVVSDRRLRLVMRATRTAGGLLKGPTTQDMGQRVAETLMATVAIQFWQRERPRDRLLFEDTGYNAGLEVHGNLARLLKMR